MNIHHLYLWIFRKNFCFWEVRFMRRFFKNQLTCVALRAFRTPERQFIRIKMYCNHYDRFIAAFVKVFRPADPQGVIDPLVKRASKRSTRWNDGRPTFPSRNLSCLPLYLNVLYRRYTATDLNEKDGVASFWKTENLKIVYTTFFLHFVVDVCQRCDKQRLACFVILIYCLQKYTTRYTRIINIFFFNQNPETRWYYGFKMIENKSIISIFFCVSLTHFSCKMLHCISNV